MLDNPAVAFWVLFGAWVAGELWIQGKHRLPPGAQSRDRGSMLVVVASVWTAVALGFAAAAVLPGAAIRTGRDVVFDAALALMLLGLLLRWYAVAVLGSSFTVTVGTRIEQRVVDRGPYRWVRHPSYTGSLLTIAGVLLSRTNLVSLLAFVLPAAGYAYRVAVEERALAAALGEPYRAYMRRTKRLIPLVL